MVGVYDAIDHRQRHVREPLFCPQQEDTDLRPLVGSTGEALRRCGVVAVRRCGSAALRRCTDIASFIDKAKTLHFFDIVV